MASLSIAPLNEPYTLPSGVVFPNRLVKAALAEGLASSDRKPNAKHSTLYAEWGQGGWGCILTGNVMVDPLHMGSPQDVALPPKDATEAQSAAILAAWKKWADDIQRHGTPGMVQLNHPGRQSPRVSRKGAALAPSAVPLDFGSGTLRSVVRSIAFGTPRAMTVAEIKTLIEQFAAAAKFASDAGFKAAQLHGAHGYLLAQFLSPLSNTRTDEYGGSAVNRARVVREIVDAVRAVVPATFALSVKINSADHQQEGGLQDCLEQVEYIMQGGGVDFLEISGGTYENPTMVGMGRESTSANEGDEAHEKEVKPEPKGGELPATARTAKREAFFLEYAEQVRAKFPDMPLMVTGGFRTRTGMRAAISGGGCDLVGLGRASVQEPRLPAQIILSSSVSDEKAIIELSRIKIPWVAKTLGIKPLNAGLVTLHYQKGMNEIIKAH